MGLATLSGICMLSHLNVILQLFLSSSWGGLIYFGEVCLQCLNGHFIVFLGPLESWPFDLLWVSHMVNQHSFCGQTGKAKEVFLHAKSILFNDFDSRCLKELPPSTTAEAHQQKWWYYNLHVVLEAMSNITLLLLRCINLRISSSHGFKGSRGLQFGLHLYMIIVLICNYMLTLTSNETWALS